MRSELVTECGFTLGRNEAYCVDMAVAELSLVLRNAQLESLRTIAPFVYLLVSPTQSREARITRSVAKGALVLVPVSPLIQLAKSLKGGIRMRARFRFPRSIWAHCVFLGVQLTCKQRSM